ncbi:MAG: tripartite tricarboxylate transporter TctB family protein [bacterium]|jgi:putative tricarboxylic transport membrane protein
MKVLKAEIIIGILLIVLSVAVFVETYDFARTGQEVGPQFVPRMLALFLALLSLVLMGNALFGKRIAGETPVVSWKNEVWFIGLSLLGLILYGFLMNWIGFMLSTLLYMGGMLLFLGERSPVLVGGWAFGVTLIMYWVFQTFLQVDLPAGLFF